MSKRYIKGKDGKLQGSLPETPKFSAGSDIVIPKIPVGLVSPAEPANGSLLNTTSEKKETYTKVLEDLEKINKSEQESLDSLAEGFSNIGEAFDIIEEIYAERIANSTAAHAKSKAALAVAEDEARTSRAKYEAILSEAKAVKDRKPINRIRKFLGINPK
jgi:uncharacterized protein YdiU (UPF0061 family)